MANKMINSKPLKMWIDGKIFPIQKISKIGIVKENNGKIKPKQEETVEHHLSIDEYAKLLHIIEDNGKFRTSIKVPKLYYSKIKNLQKFSVEKVSEMTGVEIYVPGQDHEKGIILSSGNKNSLVCAVSHIHAAIGEIRERNIALQFICIPCVNPYIIKRFENLKTGILELKNEIENLHESIFIDPFKLHVTIDVYALLDDKERGEAIKALNEYKSTLELLLQKSGPLKLDIGILECMSDNIKKTDMLYANVKIVNETEAHSLQKIVNDISEYFYHRGLAKRYQENVKLHMTVINTKYRKNNDGPKRKRHRQSIDATKIIEKFKDYSFGHCEFNSVHLSHISVKGEDGFYKPLAVIKFDKNK